MAILLNLVKKIFLERPSLGSLVVRLITRDPIGISGDEYLCVAIRSLIILALIVHTRENQSEAHLSGRNYGRPLF